MSKIKKLSKKDTTKYKKYLANRKKAIAKTKLPTPSNRDIFGYGNTKVINPTTFTSVVVESDEHGMIQVKTPSGEIIEGVTNFHLEIDAENPHLYYAHLRILSPRVNLGLKKATSYSNANSH